MDPERAIPGGVNSAMRRVAGLEGLVIVATGGATVTDSDAHNDEDVDRLLEATERAVDAVLARAS